jgi:hypothetical protein
MRFHKCIHEYGFVPVDEVDRSVCEQISAINSTDVLRGRVAQRSVYCQFMKPVAGRRVFLIDVYDPRVIKLCRVLQNPYLPSGCG